MVRTADGEVLASGSRGMAGARRPPATCGVVAEGGAAAAATAALRALGHPSVSTADATGGRPDVIVVVDGRIPPDVPRSWVGAPVIAVRHVPLTRDRIVAMFAAGADAVVHGGLSSPALGHAIDVVAQGGAVLDPVVARDLVRMVRVGRHPSSVQLTGRERDVLDAIRRGQPLATAAVGLGVAEKTLRNVQTRLFAKLGARSRQQALLAAGDLGLLRDDDRAYA
jgi:DNA-binding CsgD family transcriptional regulator